jgi:parallel beta-helix repeat protein
MAIITVFPGTNAIQNAVNAANEGDVILVNNGVYNEAVTITTNNIRIVTASNEVFLNGNNTFNFAFFFAVQGISGVEINGFNIANYLVDGINLNNSNFNLITRNTITNVGEDGINMDGGSGNLILSNTVENTGSSLQDASGIELDGPNNWVVNNTVKGNFDRGIAVFFNANRVVGNMVVNNRGAGLYVQSNFNIFENNRVKNNQNNGILLEFGAANNFIFRNLFKGNQPNNIVNNGGINNFLENRFK